MRGIEREEKRERGKIGIGYRTGDTKNLTGSSQAYSSKRVHSVNSKSGRFSLDLILEAGYIQASGSVGQGREGALGPRDNWLLGLLMPNVRIFLYIPQSIDS